jgi:hypothetical protein
VEPPKSPTGVKYPACATWDYGAGGAYKVQTLARAARGASCPPPLVLGALVEGLGPAGDPAHRCAPKKAQKKLKMAKEQKSQKKVQKSAKNSKKEYTAFGLPSWSPTLVLTELDPA